MTQVNTVRGPISVDDLGPTSIHEHFAFGYPGSDGDRTMWTYDQAQILARATEMAADLRSSGLRTVFDLTPNDCGRDPVLLRTVAEENDLTIVCSTGYYYEGEGAPSYFKFRSIFADVTAELTDLMVTELTEGIAGTGIKAGVMKVGTSEGVITDYETCILKAAAAAQQVTGAPIITHTSGGTMGPQQARLLLDAGADPAKVVIGHMCGNVADTTYQLATLRYGVGVGFDRIGLNKMFNDVTDDDRMDAVVSLMDLGYSARIFLAHDAVNHWYGRSVQGFYDLPGAEHWSTRRLGEYIVPGLLARGCSQADVDGLLTANVRSLWAATS
ncbi:MAG: phosphotriesterase-related protein [Cellulomonadaceae bacterium]|nr:phosphotriesterase-related protein [Cellulomonadaceae bacterium]